MAKIRKSASIESGLMEVLKILSDEEINKAIGKTSSYLRKCSNPDLAQQIDHNDSFKLDQACIQKGKAPPLLTAYEYMIRQLLEKCNYHESYVWRSEEFLNSVEYQVKKFGKLSEKQVKALNGMYKRFQRKSQSK